MNSYNNYYSYVSKLKSSFLPEKLRNYWNNLLDYVKFSVGVPSFKNNLESFKEECLHNCENNYWEVSNLIIKKLKVFNRTYNKFLIENPFIARRKGIKTFQTVKMFNYII